MGKRRYSIKNKKIMTEEVEALPKLLKASLCITIVGVLLSGISIYLHLGSIKLLRQADVKHRTFINKITNARLLGDIRQIGSGKRGLDGAEATELGQKQCRHRQKTEWTYHDVDSIEADNTLTVNFSASEVGISTSTALLLGR